MLEKLLREIESGGTLEVHELAKRLGTSPQMVEALLQHLARLGNLQITDSCNSPACDGCSLAADCHTNRPKLWKTRSV